MSNAPIPPVRPPAPPRAPAEAALRLAPLHDHPELIPIVADRIWHAWWVNSGVSHEELTAKVSEIAHGRELPQAVVALIDGAYAGSALLIDSDDDAHPHLSPWIAALWTEPAYRRRGIAGAMMAHLREAAHRLGQPTVYLGAQADKIGFYLAQGFQQITTADDGSGVFAYPLSHGLRPERDGDEEAISALTTRAFATAAHSSGTEAEIIEALRARGELALSLVIEEGGEILGHLAFSPVTIGGAELGWFGLGPVSVAPEAQRRGLGDRLIREGLNWLRSRGAAGVVVLGDPGYYARFGFAAEPRLTYPGPPPEYFQALPFTGFCPQGEVAYSPAFGA